MKTSLVIFFTSANTDLVSDNLAGDLVIPADTMAMNRAAIKYLFISKKIFFCICIKFFN